MEGVKLIQWCVVLRSVVNEVTETSYCVESYSIFSDDISRGAEVLDFAFGSLQEIATVRAASIEESQRIATLLCRDLLLLDWGVQVPNPHWPIADLLQRVT